jgi:TPP-dependent pyruvate/acetoin dehydrogenase alpha subunit
MSASATWRKDLLSHCKNQIHSLALYTGASLQEAADTAMSDAEELFQGRVFASKMKEREAEFKLQAAIIGRLDGLMKALSRR